MPWWERLPGRLLEEEAAIQAVKGGSVRMMLDHRWVRAANGEPRIEVNLTVGEEVHPIEIRFPLQYPEGCPSVRPVPHTKLISTHQFKSSGILCLELGPDNWHPRHTAADMIRSAWRLIAQETIATFKPIDIPSRHSSDLAERVMSSKGLLLRTEAFDRALGALDGNGEFEFAWLVKGKVRVVPVALPKSTPLVGTPPIVKDESSYVGMVVLLDDAAPDEAPADLDAFGSFVAQYGRATLGEKEPYVVVLRWKDGRTKGFLRLKIGISPLVDVPLDGNAAGRVPSEISKSLLDLKVGIVGLGSLGSKVAVSLARSGVHRFVLVDADVMMGANICRHEGTFSDVGVPKVDCVAEHIRAVVPAEPEITRYCVDVAAPTNPSYHAQMIESLAGADVIIDATANPNAFGPLAMIASDSQRPLFWSEVFGGGLGGLVAGAYPNDGPCPRCVRAGFLHATQAWPPAPIAGAIPYGGDEDAEPVAASDADVSFVAAALTNRVLDHVTGRGRAAAVSVLGLRAGWIFDAPFETVAVHVRADDWSCPRCWTVAREPDASAAALCAALFSLDDDAHDQTSA